MLSDREIYKVIPKTFTICCHPIKVIVKDEIVYHDENEGDVHRYGQWNEVACTIELAKSITIDEDIEPTPLTLIQIMTTFYHELFHCFEHFSGMNYEEQRVKLFSGCMIQFIESKLFS